MANRKLKAPESLKIDFSPSPKQYELWKLLQPECPTCGGSIKQELIGYDINRNPQYKPFCSNCGNRNIPQMMLGGGAAGKISLLAYIVMCMKKISLIAGNSDRERRRQSAANALLTSVRFNDYSERKYNQAVGNGRPLQYEGEDIVSSI